MMPVPPLSIAPQALGIDAGMMTPGAGALGLPPGVRSGFSVGGMQGALAARVPTAGQAFGRLYGMPSALDPTNAAQALMPAQGTESTVRTDAEIRKVSRDFEAIFLRMLFKEMRDTIQKTGLTGNSRAMEYFESMYDEQVAEQMAETGGVGFGDVVYRQLRQSTMPHVRTWS
jgi:flagellar protein FlgJ